MSRYSPVKVKRNLPFFGLAGGLLSIALFSTGCGMIGGASTGNSTRASGTLAVSPTTMSFGSVAVGSSQSKTGQLTASSASVTVSSASWNGTGFSVSGITFPVTIGAGQSTSFTITFAPQTASSASGTVSFLSDASNSPTSEQYSGTGTGGQQHSVDLGWNASTSSVQGYYVYRGTTNGGPYTRISSLQPGLAYTDSAVLSATTYYYVVTALGTDNVESPNSNQATAAIP